MLGEAGDDVIGMDELHVASISRRELQRDQEFDDLQLVFDEGTAGLPVLAAPLHIREFDAVALDE